MCGPTKAERETHADRLFHQLRGFSAVDVMRTRFDAGVEPPQVCRTCGKSGDRIIVSTKELVAATKAGVDIEELKCQPWKESEVKAVHANRTLTVARPDGAVAVTIGRRSPTVALVDSCGQVLLDKCRTCVYLAAIEERVPGPFKNGMTVTVGGHCRIPVNGIIVNGVTKFCVPTPRDFDPLDERRSCQTCAFQSSFGNDKQMEHATPLLGDISRFQMEEIRRNNEPEDRGMAIASARRVRELVAAPVTIGSKRTSLTRKGLMKFYRLSVERVYEKTVRKNDKDIDVPYAVDIRLPGTGKVMNFLLSEGNDDVGMVTLVSPKVAIMEITSPHHRHYGLPDNDRIDIPGRPNDRITCPRCRGCAVDMTNGPLGLPKFTLIPRANARRKDTEVAVFNYFREEWEVIRCETCGGVGTLGTPPRVYEPPERDLSHRVHSACLMCHPHKPCYYHSKAPKESEETIYHPIQQADGTIKTEIERRLVSDCQDPAAAQPLLSDSQLRITLHRNGDTVQVIDEATGELPDYFFFRLRYRSLFASCRTAGERQQVMRQYGVAQNKVDAWKRNVILDTSWALPAPADPWHRQCEVNVYDKTRTPYKNARPDVWVYMRNSSGEPTGEKELVSTARGLDFEWEWKDWFGLERGFISTNPVFSPSFSDLGQIRGLPDKDGGFKIMAQGMRLDEKFSLPKYQEQEDWLRIHNAGEALQDEVLANEHLDMMNNKAPFVGMPTDVTVTQLRPGIPGSNLTFTTTDTLLEWLSEQIWVPGNEEASGFWARNKWVALGYDDFKGTRPKRDDDISSVWEMRSQLGEDTGNTLGESSNALWICTECYDPSSDDAGQFRPDEIDQSDLSCPNPECNGIVIWYERRPEEEQGHLRTNPDQMGVDETYRRRSGAPDTTEWLTRGRLESMVCPMWKPRSRRRTKSQR